MTARYITHHPIGSAKPERLPADAFTQWLDEQIAIEIAELGGMTEAEAEGYAERRANDPEYIAKMRRAWEARP